MDNIQQDIQTLVNTHKSTVRWIIVTMIVVILLLLFRLFYGHEDPIIIRDDQKVHNIMDSLQIWTKQQKDVQEHEQKKYLQDSLRLYNIQLQVNKVPGMLQAINNKYNEKLHTIDTMSADGQFDLFSEWITSTDSL